MKPLDFDLALSRDKSKSAGLDDNSALKVNIIVIFYLNPFYVNVPFLYPLKIFGFLKFSRDIEIEKRNFP